MEADHLTFEENFNKLDGQVTQMLDSFEVLDRELKKVSEILESPSEEINGMDLLDKSEDKAIKNLKVQLDRLKENEKVLLKQLENVHFKFQ